MRGGMGNMNNMMKQMQKMQKDMAKAQEELAKKSLKHSWWWNGELLSQMAIRSSEVKN